MKYSTVPNTSGTLAICYLQFGKLLQKMWSHIGATLHGVSVCVYIDNTLLRWGEARPLTVYEHTLHHFENTSYDVNDMYSSPDVIRVIKWRRMRLAGHVARMGTGGVHVRFWWGDVKERDHLKYLGVDGRITLKWMFNKWAGNTD